MEGRAQLFLTVSVGSGGIIIIDAGVIGHVQKLHGSHVILCTNGGEPGDQDITEAASLAAYYSQAKDSANVPVDCTQVKYVKNPAGARPGMVIYATYRTVNVTPEEDLVRRLQNGK